MFKQAVVQGIWIGAFALTIGAIDSYIKPVKWWESDKPSQPGPIRANPPLAAAPPPAKPPAGGTGTNPAPQAPIPPSLGYDDRMVTLARVKELMAASVPLQIIDAREPAEFAEGRIPGAINIPPGEFFGKVPDIVHQRLSRDLPIVVYCGGGNCDASKLVAMRLKDLGFSQTYVFEEGFTGWTKAGEGVEK